VTPSPDLHFAYTEAAGSGGVASEHDFEYKIVPAGYHPPFETR
jgi:hypothetical protein